MKPVGLAALLVVVFAAGWLMARTGMGAAIDPASLPEVEREFVEKMNGAALVGRFTVAGREDRQADAGSLRPLQRRQGRRRSLALQRQDRRIRRRRSRSSCTMRFVDDTPVILMTDATIPGMGTFTARVFFYGDEYAGTWDHDGRGGGHMFGRMERGGAGKP